MARLNIGWESVSNVAPSAATTGEAQATEGAQTSARADRPMMIYVLGNDPTHKSVRKLEDVVFRNEQVGIGAKFFKTIKMSEADALQDRILKDAGRSAPRIVFLKRDFTVSSVLQNRISAGTLLKAMKKLVKSEYKNSFEKMVREYGKMLNELDRLEGKRGQLADQAARLQNKPSPSKAKKLARDQQEYEADMEDWRKRETELLSFQAKGEPGAQA